MIRHDEDPALRNSVDAEDLGSEVAAVQEGGHGERIAARLGVEAERIVAYLIEMGPDAGDARVEVLPDHLFGDSDDTVADGSEHLPQGGLPQEARPTPASEWHDRAPLRHEAILETEAAAVN
jgi:hypothetical protein